MHLLYRYFQSIRLEVKEKRNALFASHSASNLDVACAKMPVFLARVRGRTALPDSIAQIRRDFFLFLQPRDANDTLTSVLWI